MLRLVVLGLAVANLLYFGWATLVGSNEPRLVAVAPGPRTAPALPPPPPPCTTVGPFTDPEATQAARAALEAAGWGVMPREVREEVADGYWVTVENLASAAVQRRVVNTIRAAGIADAFAMSEDPGFRVSVGVFRDRSRAEGRAALVRRLDIEAGVRDRTREDVATWLDVPGIPAATLADGRLEGTGIDVAALAIQACP